MRVVPHDLAILAGARFGLVGVDHQIMWTSVRFFRHERPLQAGRKSGAAATAQTRRLYLFDYGVAALFQNCLGAIPGAARTCALQAPVVLAVEIAEDAVFISQHRSRLFLERSSSADRCRKLAIDLRT